MKAFDPSHFSQSFGRTCGQKKTKKRIFQQIKKAELRSKSKRSLQGSLPMERPMPSF
jgi:hypothetical protein